MAKKSDKPSPRLLNRKALFRYEILEKIECGVILLGSEVKSLRLGQAVMDESFARLNNGQAWLRGLHIAPYEHGHILNHEPLRPRKLLMHKLEMARLEAKVAVKGLTLIPLDIHFSERGLAKVTLALARGKTVGDKRRSIREREDKREMSRALRRK